MIRTAAPLLLALSTACTFDGGFGTGLLCPTGECPPGETCVDGRCGVAGDLRDAALFDGPPMNTDDTPDAGTGENLLRNPGMENGTQSWSSFDATLVSSTFEPRNGERAMGVCAATGGEFSLYQDVLPFGEVIKGEHFSASIWVQSTIYGPEPNSMRLTLRESGGVSPLEDHDGSVARNLGNQWMQITAEATVVEADRENLILIAWGLDSDLGACFGADDAAVYQGP